MGTLIARSIGERKRQICEARLSRNRCQPPVPSQPERKSQQNDPEHEGVHPNPQYNGQRSSARCEQD